MYKSLSLLGRLIYNKYDISTHSNPFGFVVNSNDKNSR